MTTKVLPTGEVLCLVEVPPEYRTITKPSAEGSGPHRWTSRWLRKPRVITRQVVDQSPPTPKSHLIPAVFETVKIKILHGLIAPSPYTIAPAVTSDLHQGDPRGRPFAVRVEAGRLQVPT